MSDQLSFVEPTGDEVIHLAQRCECDADQFYDLAVRLELSGMPGKAREYKRRSDESIRWACQYWMLAEFEALGGVRS